MRFTAGKSPSALSPSKLVSSASMISKSKVFQFHPFIEDVHTTHGDSMYFCVREEQDADGIDSPLQASDEPHDGIVVTATIG